MNCNGTFSMHLDCDQNIPRDPVSGVTPTDFNACCCNAASPTVVRPLLDLIDTRFARPGCLLARAPALEGLNALNALIDLFIVDFGGVVNAWDWDKVMFPATSFEVEEAAFPKPDDAPVLLDSDLTCCPNWEGPRLAFVRGFALSETRFLFLDFLYAVTNIVPRTKCESL